MREDNYGNSGIVDRIASQFWKCVNVLTNMGVYDHPELILFFVSAYKDGLLINLENSNPHNLLDVFHKNIYEDSFYDKIYKVYYPIVEELSSRGITELFYHITEINKHDLELFFPEVFENLLQKIIANQGKHSGESVQPEEISRLIIKLANLPSNAKVYNPFAGLASFGVLLEGNQEYHGQEINPNTWAIGQMRLKAHNKGFFYGYELNNSIENWNDFQKFDLIVASPPFKLPVPRHFHSKFNGEPYGTVENFLIDKGLHSIKDGGQVIAMFSLSFLFNGGRIGRLRKRLVNNNLIDTIITLPSGLLSNTNIPVCIVVFKTEPRHADHVRMIDASTFLIKNGPRSKFLNDQALFDFISNDSENDFLRYVNNSEIAVNDFDLSVGRYFLKVIQGAPLHSFTEIITGSKAPQGLKMRQVQIRNLKDDVFNSTLKSNEIDLSLVIRGTFRIIEESCVLIATRWNSLKPTYFKYTGEPIVISRSVVALRLNGDIVDPTFLINEFSVEYVKEQLDAYRVGAVQPMLRNRDLEKIVFQLPPIEEQRAKVSGIIELSSRIKELETDKESLLSGFKKEETESSTSLSHILGKPLLSIGSSLEIIQSALSIIDPNWKDIVISERRQFKMSDAFESISKNVKYIQELADVNTALVSVSSFNLIEIHFLKFLSEFIKTEKKSLNGNIELKLDIHDDIKEQMNNQVLIKGNKQKLKIVLTNLIDNAKNHAFINRDQEHKINIEILPFTGNEQEADQFNYDIDGRKSYIEVKVSNTGKPFPKDLRLGDYVRKSFAVGETKNRGLGGYEVNEILKVHNDGKQALNIISNQELDYCTTISFLLPII